MPRVADYGNTPMILLCSNGGLSEAVQSPDCGKPSRNDQRLERGGGRPGANRHRRCGPCSDVSLQHGPHSVRQPRHHLRSTVSPPAARECARWLPVHKEPELALGWPADNLAEGCGVADARSFAISAVRLAVGAIRVERDHVGGFDGSCGLGGGFRTDVEFQFAHHWPPCVQVSRSIGDPHNACKGSTGHARGHWKCWTQSGQSGFVWPPMAIAAPRTMSRRLGAHSRPLGPALGTSRCKV